jgi:hypothetical protein
VDCVVNRPVGEEGSAGSISEKCLEQGWETNCWAAQCHAVAVVEADLLVRVTSSSVMQRARAYQVHGARLSALGSHRHQ